MEQIDIVGQLITGLGLGALIVLGYGFVLRHLQVPWQQGFASAVVFGCGAVAAMTNTIELQAGYVFDARAVFIVLSGPFAGPFACVLVSVLAAIARIWIGGEGMVAGLAGIAIAGAVGVIFSLYASKPLRLRSFLILGALTALNGFSLLLVGVDRAFELFVLAGAPLVAVDIIGTVLLGSALEGTRRETTYLHDVEFNADRDPLTGLYNRRALAHFESRIEREATGEKKTCCAILLDIDRFKVVNDRYGHSCGDEVLKRVAASVSARVRRSDLAARYGGEEIAIVLLSVSSEDGFRIAEQIRTTIGNISFTHEGEVFSITVSAGVAGFTTGETRLSTALDFADRALYRAKNAGRNRTEILNAGPQEPPRARLDALSTDAV